MIQHIDVHAVLRASVSGVYTDLVTRPTGRAVRERIERDIGDGRAAVAVMDFTGVGCLDYSCADEIVANLLRERVRVLLLRGVTEAHRDAIEAVLAGHGLAVVIERSDGTLEALGPSHTAEGLFQELVARRLAARTPGGTFALTVS
ncbi:MAG TPA: hypothetical protein VGA20_01680 [Gemmatimonadales bacterium]